MPRLSVDNLCAASDKAWTQKSHFDELINEAYQHALPSRNQYTYNVNGKPQGFVGTQGKDKTSRRVFDSTLQTDTIKIANRIQYELFPIGQEWASFRPGPFVNQTQQQQARSDLHNLQKLVFTAIQFSNFDLAIAEWLLDLIVAGTACMLISRGDDDNPIIYQAVPQSHVAMREGALGKIDLISRVHKMRASLIQETWTDAKPVEIPEGVEDKDPEIDLIEVNYFSIADRKWYYDVAVVGGITGKQKFRVVERESDSSQWVISRWIKAAGEVQGRSLVMEALPDARVLSAVKRYLLQNAAMSVAGVWLVKNEGMVNARNVRIFPGATIPVRTTGGPAGASVAPLQTGGDVNLADLVIRDLVNSIHKIMMNEGLPDVSEGVRTATELIERMKELQQNLGSPFARILKEGIVPMLEATIDVLADQGVIPVQTGRKIKLNNGEIDVKFASPLVQGQSIREVEAARNAMAITKEAAGDEAVGLNFKIEDFGAFVASKLGVVPDLVRNRGEREKMQKDAAQLIATQGNQPVVGGAGGVQPPPANQQQQNAGPVQLAA